MTVKGRLLGEIRKAVALLQSGDRSGALGALRSLVRQDAGAIVREVTHLGACFRCDRLGIEALRVQDCLSRRSRIWSNGRWKGEPTPEAADCQGCDVGQALSSRFPGYKPPQAQPFIRLGRFPRHRRAEDPVALAAAMTPDDENDWRA